MDCKDGSGIYAVTKSLGEVTTGAHLTLRTSTVGPEIKKNGVGLFHWFMNQNGAIDGYERTFWSGGFYTPIRQIPGVGDQRRYSRHISCDEWKLYKQIRTFMPVQEAYRQRSGN